MGSPAAVVYTNIFMFAIEEWHLPSFVTLAKFSGRYIDDIITIQPRAGPVGLLLSLAEDSFTAFDLPSFMVTLNEVSPVRFTCESSYDELLALDMTLYRDNNGTVSTKTHFKPHNKFLYVSPLSDHLSHTWRALVRGELLRIHRACSSRQIALSHARFLADRFDNRGFVRRLIWKAYDEISRLPSSFIR